MEEPHGISSSTLKITAIICMTANHAGYIFSSIAPAWAFELCLIVGGVTFPIMAFLITEGFRRTSNVKRYALRLLVFALIAEVPYWLFLSHSLNILFTLLIGLGLLYCDQVIENRSLFAVAVVAGCALSMLCDWALLGPLSVLIYAKMRDLPGGTITASWIIAACVAVPELFAYLSNPWVLNLFAAGGGVFGGIFASLMLPRYHGKRGLPLKYFFYAYYPAHILVLGLAFYALTGMFPPLP